jgi:hypothetical protein
LEKEPEKPISVSTAFVPKKGRLRLFFFANIIGKK